MNTQTFIMDIVLIALKEVEVVERASTPYPSSYPFKTVFINIVIMMVYVC